MKRLIFCIAALSLAVPAAAAPGGKHGHAEALSVKAKNERRDVGRFRLRPQRFVFSGDNAAGVKFLDYLIFSPTNAIKGKVPMVVYIPGNGEMGDVGRQFRHKGIFEKLTSDEFQKRHPCYLVALTLPKRFDNLVDGLPGRPSPNQLVVMRAVSDIARSQAAPRVDANRLYIVGFSYGGGAVYGLMTSCPRFFAAGIAVASFPPPPSFATSPLRIWHAYNDGDYRRRKLKPSMLAPFADAVKAAGGEFRIDALHGKKHDAWTAAWKKDAMWDWLFSAVKTPQGPVMPSAAPRPDAASRSSARRRQTAR